MRILELGKYYPPYRGGMETLLRSWSEGFAQRGAEVNCIVANDRPATVVETINQVRVHRLARYGVALSTALCPAYLFAPRRHPADVWHLHFPNPLGDLACLAGPRHVPLVIHYHSDIIRQAGTMKAYGSVVRKVLRRAARVVVATPQHIEYSPWLSGIPEKCEVIPFGTDLSRFEPNPETMRRAAELRAEARGRPILLAIGRLVGYKGHRYLIEAARKLDACVWIIGSGPLEAELKTQAAGVRARFPGEVPDEELPAWLHACDIFALPSITPNEAFGLVQIEAMACGKPVVSCNLKSGVPFVNRHEVTGFVVPPADSAALEQALKQLIADPGLRGKFGAAGRKRAVAEFSETVMIERYWNCLKQAAR